MKRHAVLVGSVPPPYVGDSVAFGLVVDEFRRRGLPHTVINIGGGRDTKKDSAFSLSRLFDLLGPFFRALAFPFRRNRILYLTIAQSWCGFLRDTVFILMAWLGGYRIVLHVHGGNYAGFRARLSGMKRRLLQSVLEKSSRVLVLAECFREHFSFLNDWPSRVAVMHNGIDLEPKADIVDAKRWPSGDEPLEILYLSNLFETKGYLDVVEAARLLKEEGAIPFRVHLCGQFLTASDSTRYATPAEAEADFRRRIEAGDLADVVQWHGVVRGDEKLSMLDRAHVMVLPTAYGNEGEPISLLEGMARGCLILATAYRAIPEMIAGGEAGVYVQYGAPETIAQAIREMTPARFDSLRKTALERVRSVYTREAHLKNILAEIFGPGQNLETESEN